MTSTFLRQGLALRFTNHPYAPTGRWLLSVSGLVIGMIHVGGLTRLTQSGLSMTTWSISGSLPPRSLLEWQIEFERYQQFPEWEQRKSMSLQEFQYIYWWEYAHRMLGRAVGVVYLLPWMYFTMRHRIPPGLQPRLFVLGSLGGLQGMVGWWMVQSGLSDDRRGDSREIRVKPIRLATHLSMAMLTYSGLLWTAMDVLSYNNNTKIDCSKAALQHAQRMRIGGIALTSLAAITIVSGALVAGNDAGRAYNTFPKMNDQWIPEEVVKLSPRNLMEDTATVQWNHRVLGTATAVTGVTVAAVGMSQRHLLTPQVQRALLAASGMVVAQFSLGVTTLLYYVPISLAAVHQLGSVAVLTSGLYLVHTARYARPSFRTACEKIAKRVVV